MKIIIKTQYNEIGGEYMADTEDAIEIFKLENSIFLRIDNKQYEIPIDIFKGLL